MVRICSIHFFSLTSVVIVGNDACLVSAQSQVTVRL